MSILNVPQDVLSVIFSFLPVRDVGRCKRCCVVFHTAASDETLWARLLRRDCSWVEIRPSDSAEALYKSLSQWCFESSSAVDFSNNFTQVERAPADRNYQVPHAKRIMTMGVHSWEVIVQNAAPAYNWFFVGVGTHSTASCGGYSKSGSTCLDRHAYVLGTDGYLYHGSNARDVVTDPDKPGCYGFVLDCNKHKLHFFLEGKYLGHLPVPAEPLVAIVEVGRDNSASIRPPLRDYTHVTLE